MLGGRGAGAGRGQVVPAGESAVGWGRRRPHFYNSSRRGRTFPALRALAFSISLYISFSVTRAVLPARGAGGAFGLTLGVPGPVPGPPRRLRAQMESEISAESRRGRGQAGSNPCDPGPPGPEVPLGPQAAPALGCLSAHTWCRPFSFSWITSAP